MQIQGETVYLEPIKRKDSELIVNWRNKDFVRKNFLYQELFTIEGHEHWLDTQVNTGKVLQWIIYDKRNQKPIGSVYLRDIHREYEKAEYGIFIGEESALGKGFGTETAKLVVQYAFEQEKLHKVMLRVLAQNERAMKSYEKAGFVQEAYLKDEVKIESHYYDIIFMAQINPENK